MPDGSEAINDIITHLGEDIDLISTTFDAGRTFISRIAELSGLTGEPRALPHS